MALTPEDVVNKIFTAKQFRRGYDENQVDDFLDQVVAELRRLLADNDDLRSQLEQCQKSRGVKPTAAGASAGSDRSQGGASTKSGVSTKSADAARAEADRRVKAALVAADKAEQEAAERIAKARAAAEHAESQAAERAKAGGAAPAAQDPRAGGGRTQESAVSSRADTAQLAGDSDGGAGVGGAAEIIALAQRLHDEHVSEGKSTRERLINEGQAEHDKAIGEGQSQHDELLSTGQSKYDELLSTGQARHDELTTTAQSRHDELIAAATTRHEQLIAEGTQRSKTMVGEAEEKKKSVLEALARERDTLSANIEQLRAFERDYRARLKSYIEGQLHELDHTARDEDGAEPDSSADTASAPRDQHA